MESVNQKIFDPRWIMQEVVAESGSHDHALPGMQQTAEGIRIDVYERQTLTLTALLFAVLGLAVLGCCAFGLHSLPEVQQWPDASVLAVNLCLGAWFVFTAAGSLAISMLRQWLVLDAAGSKITIHSATMGFRRERTFEGGQIQGVCVIAKFDSPKSTMPNWRIRLMLRNGGRPLSLTTPLVSGPVYSGWKTRNDYDIATREPRIALFVSRHLHVPLHLVCGKESIPVNPGAAVLTDPEKQSIIQKHNRKISGIRNELLLRFIVVAVVLGGLAVKEVSSGAKDSPGKVMALAGTILIVMFIGVAVYLYISRRKVGK